MKQPKVKEKIIETTIRLIKENEGDLSNISTRVIAKEANVANGLMNYHFKTKEELITIAVQRIISEVVDSYEPPVDHASTFEERLVTSATIVFEFLFLNPAVSRISMLDDYNKKDGWGNTLKSQISIKNSIYNDLEGKERDLFAFILVSSMQAAFLSSSNSVPLMGYNLNVKEERHEFIKDTVHMLLHGVSKK